MKFRSASVGKRNKRVVFLLTGWHNKIWEYWITAKTLQLNGFNCVTYEYDGDTLSPNTKQTVEKVTAIEEDILEKIKKLKERGHSEFAIFGTSLGSLIALMVGNRSPDVSKIILNTTGSDLAQTVWSWDKVNKGFKEKLIDEDLTLDRLEKIWRKITPINNVDNLKNKKLLIYLSEKDEIIPFVLGRELVEDLKKKNYDTTVIVNPYLDHFLTGAIDLFKANTYLKFLKS
ncbi:alpha/beta hydrolase [Candidatus Microgenomates bacterium]|nr:alpha/beta hydrolase [Candidatus Microgenomates bacterium]